MKDTINTERLIEIFFKLVSINSISKAEKPVADFIREFLNALGIESHEDKSGKIVSGNSGNIIAKISGLSDNLPVAFVSHMDTIKSTLGIKPQIVDNKVVSDGTTILGADNRAGIAIILYAIEELILHKKPTRSIETIFTIGEETGLYGSQNLDLTLVESRTAYILDSSASPGYYVYSAPEAYEFQIEIIGKASHAAVHPENGVNALKIASELIQKYPIGKIDETTTINFGTICGGEGNNVVPSKINISGEIRSFDSKTIKVYSQELDNCLKIITKKFKGSYNLNGNFAFPGFKLDLSSDAVNLLNESLHAVGLTPKPIRYHGGSDANILNNRGIVALNLGIGAKNPHSTSEYIAIEDMKKMVQVLLDLATVKN